MFVPMNLWRNRSRYICGQCAAIVVDREAHTRWHTRLSQEKHHANQP